MHSARRVMSSRWSAKPAWAISRSSWLAFSQARALLLDLAQVRSAVGAVLPHVNAMDYVDAELAVEAAVGQGLVHQHGDLGLDPRGAPRQERLGVLAVAVGFVLMR
jgi:hypothetical protein